jgi:hypothetical protein
MSLFKGNYFYYRSCRSLRDVEYDIWSNTIVLDNECCLYFLNFGVILD